MKKVIDKLSWSHCGHSQTTKDRQDHDQSSGGHQGHDHSIRATVLISAVINQKNTTGAIINGIEVIRPIINQQKEIVDMSESTRVQIKVTRAMINPPKVTATHLGFTMPVLYVIQG